MANRSRNLKKVAIVVAEEFEDSEVKQPREYLESAGIACEFIGIASNRKVSGKKGYEVITDKSIIGVDTASYAGLLIPGGHAPDKLRTDRNMVFFVKSFVATGKPVAAICHGPQLLIEAEVVTGRTVTSWPSVRTDLINAGAKWVDREVVEDGNLITSRKPADLPAFCAAFSEKL